MREYTKVVTIKVIASVMAESEDDAEVSAFGTWGTGDPNDRREFYASSAQLIQPQVIGRVAYRPVAVSHDSFKARSFKEAVCEVEPDIESGCEAARVVYPPGYPGLPD
jgi:hypothetical protein